MDTKRPAINNNIDWYDRHTMRCYAMLLGSLLVFFDLTNIEYGIWMASGMNALMFGLDYCIMVLKSLFLYLDLLFYR